jgi:predicted transcriptional regulator
LGEEKDALLHRRRGNVARQAAYYHLTEHCGIRAAQVAAMMGVSPSAVTKGVKAISALLQDDASLEAMMNSLIP